MASGQRYFSAAPLYTANSIQVPICSAFGFSWFRWQEVKRSVSLLHVRILLDLTRLFLGQKQKTSIAM